MKRVGNLYNSICDISTIKLAIARASKGKTRRKTVRATLLNIDASAERIQRLLATKAYTPSPYKELKFFDKTGMKLRTIHKPAFFPDQIIHWCLVLVLQPLFMRGMYHHNCGSIPGRGIHHGLKAVKKWISKDRKNTKYAVKCDISKFYQSIDHNILKALLRKKIKDPDALWLLDSIIDSHPDGLPIGNYTSQWLSNFYLQEFDHFVKQELGIEYYVRYMDDFIFFGPNKKALHQARRMAEVYLRTRLALKIKDNWQVFRVDDRGIDFVGYRSFRGYCLLRKRNSLRIARKLRRIRKKERMSPSDAMSIMSHMGWLRHCNAGNFIDTNIRPYFSFKKLKEAIRRESKLKYIPGTDSAVPAR
jgi:hypothetical protein